MPLMSYIVRSSRPTASASVQIDSPKPVAADHLPSASSSFATSITIDELAAEASSSSVSSQPDFHPHTTVVPVNQGISDKSTQPYREQTSPSIQQNRPAREDYRQKQPTSLQSTTLFHSLPEDQRAEALHEHIYVNTSQEQTSTPVLPDRLVKGMSSPSQYQNHSPEGAHTTRIPPPPPPPPKSILKQNYTYKQELSDGAEYWQDNAELGQSNRGGHRSMLDNPEYQRQMAENLQAHRQRRTVPQQHQQGLPFNGPFFRLEEVGPVQSGPADSHINQQTQHRYEEEEGMRPRSSSSSIEHYNHQDLPLRPEEVDDEGVVVFWPPLDYNNKKRPTCSPKTKNMRDPETLQEFQRQKKMEMEAIRQNEEREMRLRDKQFQAAKLQQEQLLQRQEHNQGVANESLSLYQSSSTTGAQIVGGRCVQTPFSDPGQQTFLSSPNLRVFEARPISSFSGDSGLPVDATCSTLSTVSPSWKRTYIVENKKEAEKLKNEILTSNEVLEKERFEIDLLKRRETFVEKVETPPEIKRLGRRWQAPPEKPYVWPTLRKPVTIQTPTNESAYNLQTDYNIMIDKQEEYRWTPVVRDPSYKQERKNFTPTHSPPEPYRSGTLDEVAKRQTRHVIQPCPDGSHRPKPAFRHGRQTPSGGFFPHAPNAIKVVKKRNTQISNSLSPGAVKEERNDVQIIHKLDYHAADLTRQKNRLLVPRSATPGLDEWQKIYGLTPHSSTLTDKATNTVPRVDIKQRMRSFQPPQASPTSRRMRSVSGPASDLSQLTLNEIQIPRSQLSPAAQKSLEQLRSGQSSPAPASYEKARKYVPPALPPGYRLSKRNSQKQEEVFIQPAGHTKRMAQKVENVAASHHYNKESLAAHKLKPSPSHRQQHTRPGSAASVHFSNSNGRPSPARSRSEFSSVENQPPRAAARSHPTSSDTYRTSSRTVERHHYPHS